MCTAAPFGRLSHCVDCSVVSFVVLSWAGGLGFVPGPGRDAGCFVFVVDFPFVFLIGLLHGNGGMGFVPGLGRAVSVVIGLLRWISDSVRPVVVV